MEWELTQRIFNLLRILFKVLYSITTSELDSWINSDKDEYGNPIPTEPPTVTPTPPTVTPTPPTVTPTPPTLQMRVNNSFHHTTHRTVNFICQGYKRYPLFSCSCVVF